MIGCEILIPRSSALWLRCFRMLRRIKVIEAIGTPSFWIAGDETPWNRRLRRSMERSQGVLVHVCSGLQDWVHRPRSDYRVLSIDIANGQDILSNGVWSYLTRLAKLGFDSGGSWWIAKTF